MGRDWVSGFDDERLLLDTERAFVPVWLIGRDGRPEIWNEVLKNHHLLVIRGEAGSGKSTLLRFITLIMTKALLERKARTLLKQYWDLPPLLPLRVELRRCASGLGVEELIKGSIHCVSADYIDRQLRKGGVLIMLDGLDEIIDKRRRTEIIDEIRGLTHSLCPPNRLLITTRLSSYRHHILAREGYALYTLQELNPNQQEEMVWRYYKLWSENRESDFQWQQRAQQLIKEIFENQGLAKITSNPLLLALVSVLHSRGELRLPVGRPEIYQTCISHLINRRTPDYEPTQETNQWMAVLGEIALNMHLSRREMLTYSEMRSVLAEALSRRPELQDVTPENLLERMEKDWGVLVLREEHDRGPNYGFLNPAFQRYLTAHIIHHRSSEYHRFLIEHLEDEWWQDVIALYTAMGSSPDVLAASEQIVEELVHRGRWIQAGRCLINRQGRSAWRDEIVRHLKQQAYGSSAESIEALAVLCCIQPEFILELILGLKGPWVQEEVRRSLLRITDPDARYCLREALVKAARELNIAKVRERITLAEALGLLGDTRLGQFVQIHVPNRREILEMSRYPVTNVEYAQFVKGRKHRAPQHWEQGQYPLHLANHPVTYVSLEDARAYCEWLSKETGFRYHYRLPTEAEWLAAAGGKGKPFPWEGDSFDQCRCNGLGNIGSTTPVGIYIEGETPGGVADLLGNVWEWTETHRGKRHVLKGGAWDSTKSELTLQARRYELPNVCQPNIGFRIVRVQVNRQLLE